MLELNLEYHKGILFVRLSGELTKQTSYKLNQNLIPMIQKHKIKYLVYNLYDLEKVDCNGLQALQNGQIAIQKNNGKIYMCEIPLRLYSKFTGLGILETRNELSALQLLKI